MTAPERRPALLGEFLAVLRVRGVGIGVREYFEVAQLIDRCPDDLRSLRIALASILATDPEEEKLIHETFDELYPRTWSGYSDLQEFLLPALADSNLSVEEIENELKRLGDEGIVAPPPTQSLPLVWRQMLLRYWPGLLLLLMVAAAVTYIVRPHPPVPGCYEQIKDARDLQDVRSIRTVEACYARETRSDNSYKWAYSAAGEALPWPDPLPVVTRCFRGGNGESEWQFVPEIFSLQACFNLYSGSRSGYKWANAAGEDPLPWPPAPKENGEEDLKGNPPDTLQPPAPLPDWNRVAALGGTLALVSFGWLHWLRTGRDARRDGYGVLALSLDHLEGPQTYILNLQLAPPFEGGLLDDVAMLLSRQASVAKSRGEIDVELSLDATLDAGLAPQLVYAHRTSVEPILILEDASVEMRAHRPRVRGLLAALQDRGVYFEHWQFDGDARDFFADETGLTISLPQLIRHRQASALLIISTGSGIIDSDSGEIAEWVGKLDGWLSRAWLHPSADVTSWRRAVNTLPLPVWPMNAEGLMSAARHLATGEETDARTAEMRVVTPSPPIRPLQVTRLRHLLDLAPRRDAEIAELLRQQFCPSVPPAAVAEALFMPPLDLAPAIGPADEDVRLFLIELLDRNRPPAGSAAELRWRLDRALLGVHVPQQRQQAQDVLAELAQGPLATEVAVLVKPVVESREFRKHDGAVQKLLEKQVLVPISRRAKRAGQTGVGRRQWQWPKPAELILPTLLFAVVMLSTQWLGPWFEFQPAVIEAFDLELRQSDEDTFRGEFQLLVFVNDQGQALIERLEMTSSSDFLSTSTWLYRQGAAGNAEPVVESLPVVLDENQRGYWYWISELFPDGSRGVSNTVWVDSPVGESVSVFKREYGSGVRAYLNGNYSGAIEALEWAIAEEPKAQAKVQFDLKNTDAYIPYYFIGQAKYKMDDCDGAQVAWDTSLSQGVVQGTQEFADLQASQAACAALNNQRDVKQETGARDGKRVVVDEFSGRSRVFVSSQSVRTDFGGARGADRLCQGFADDAGLGGRWMAWLADSETSPRDRFSRDRGGRDSGYVRLDGKIVAEDWKRLTSGNLENPISIDEFGNDVGNAEVWTNTNADGSTSVPGACEDWRLASKKARNAPQGIANRTDRGWFYRYMQFCDRADDRLYCFEQVVNKASAK